MRLRSLIILTFCALFLASCTLIRERRERKKLANIEYVRQYEDDAWESIETDDNGDADAIASINKPILDENVIWYHPNPWWRIETSPFAISKDSLIIRRFAAQYGFSSFIHPHTQIKEATAWNEWMDRNHLNSYGNQASHMWQTFISANKEIFSKHPEYLAEINGIRSGYGKANKLCVTNTEVQKLFIEYIQSSIQKNPKLKIYSIEPSDGTNHCTCKECSKLGSVSNKVFYFSNIVANAIKKSHPSKELAVLAYYQHADTPSFRIEDNIKVFVAPNGFQTRFTFDGLMKAWSEKHKNIGLREYLGIPQWKAEQPRIIVDDFYKPISKDYFTHINSLIYEAGTNINAIIIATLLSKTMMNPSISWDEAFNKFLSDCFPTSKEPISRLLKRWHQYGNYSFEDVPISIYDLEEATKLTKDKNEQERIRDLKTYLIAQILYLQVLEDKENTQLRSNYFDFLYNVSHRNVVNTYAITKIQAKFISSSTSIKEKYEYKNVHEKTWIKYMNNQQIDALFDTYKKKFPPQKTDVLNYKELEKILMENTQFKPLSKYSRSILNDNSISLFSASNKLEISSNNIKVDTILVTIHDVNKNFIDHKLLTNGQKWTIHLPGKGIYKISLNRRSSAIIEFNGSISPIFQSTNDSNEKNYKTTIISHDKKLKALDVNNRPSEKVTTYYILEQKN